MEYPLTYSHEGGGYNTQGTKGVGDPYWPNLSLSHIHTCITIFAIRSTTGFCLTSALRITNWIGLTSIYPIGIIKNGENHVFNFQEGFSQISRFLLNYTDFAKKKSQIKPSTYDSTFDTKVSVCLKKRWGMRLYIRTSTFNAKKFNSDTWLIILGHRVYICSLNS